jgi:hypothetical protein
VIGVLFNPVTVSLWAGPAGAGGSSPRDMREVELAYISALRCGLTLDATAGRAVG